MFEKLFTAFEEAGEELFFVGGVVRDWLILRAENEGNFCGTPTLNFWEEAEDVDFATSATPTTTMAILRKTGLRAIPIGFEFGTIATKIEDMKVEITTFRCDESYKKRSRKPSVVFGNNIKDDLARRDFTMNAIAMKKDRTLIDPFGGVKDIKNRHLKTPIGSETSFSDDPLRMLRACRFHARFGGTLDQFLVEAMTKLSHKIVYISKERVFEEMSKLLMVKDPSAGLELMADSGILEHTFPELQIVKGFNQNQGKWHSKLVWPHTLGVVKNSPQILEIRWSALMHDIAKPQTYSETESGVHFYTHEVLGAKMWYKIARRLKVSNKFKDHVGQLIFEHLNPGLLAESENVSDKALRRLAYRLGDRLENLFHLSIADITSSNPERVARSVARTKALKKRVDEIIKKDNVVQLKLPKGTGLKLIEGLGLSGKELGNAMKALTQKLIDGEVSLESDFVVEAKRIMENN